MDTFKPEKRGRDYYFLGAKLEGIHSDFDFPSNKEGLHISYHMDQWEPVLVFINSEASTYSFNAKEAAASPQLMDALCQEDQQTLKHLAALQAPEPDYSKWGWVLV